MANTHTETFTLRPAQCDMGYLWRPSAILETMQDTAGVHSIHIGVDRNTLWQNGGLIWIVTRLKVEMTRMPRSGETITLETYPTAPRHMFFPRSHIFRDESGEQIGSANSLWATMDFENRRMVKSEFVLSKMPDNSDLSPAAGIPATIRALDSDIEEGLILPQYTDLDVNEHVNNTKYLDWCCNALGVETMSKMYISSFDINYDNEIRPGVNIQTQLTRNGDRFSFLGFSGETKHFSIGGVLFPRD